MTATTAADDPVDGRLGLTAAQVAERVAAGRVNVDESSVGRSTGEIIRANVFTYFNGLIASLTVLVLIFGSPADALFGIIAVVNVVIGVVQELRAKKTLDSLAVLNAPKARVLRDGSVVEIEVTGVVEDDVLLLAPGDQVVVDGEVLEADHLGVDESLLTGEADPMSKHAGDEVLSGSFVTAGSGRFRATRVGGDAYAAKLAAEAKRFTLVRSELRDGITTILRFITIVLIPVGLASFASQLWRVDLPFADAVVRTVASLVGMIPEGLVLLTSVALAVSVVRLGRRKTLVQELAAVEGLARVDTVCLDKTGTLTEGGIQLETVEALGGTEASLRDALGAFARADENPNPTQLAVSEAIDAPTGAWRVTGTVPFSSARKWSAVAFTGEAPGTYVFGAPEVILAEVGADDPVRRRADELAATGRRVLLLAFSPDELAGEELPDAISPMGLVTLSERIRADAPETLAYFREQGVDIKVISGDNPLTVAAVARTVGVPDAEHGVDARTLPDDPEALADVLETNAVFGRVQPQQKQAMVHALQARGHTVAMTGDGVNDVLALKDADIGVAMGSGSAASRAVAQLVLLDGRYTSLPLAVAEGRRVIANIERVATLFVTKNAYAALLALAAAMAGVVFPFLPRHLTLVNFLTIGVPGFFLSLAPSTERARTGFVSRVLWRSVPAGVVSGAAVFLVFLLSGTSLSDGALTTADASSADTEASSLAVMALLGVGLFVTYLVARPMSPPRWALMIVLVAAAVLAFVIPWSKDFFMLQLPDELSDFAGVAIVVPIAWVILEVVWRWVDRRLAGHEA
ncbi:MAG: HAD-IC family P-type ATPase [Acidimicrobiales bacterium]|nr:HAD-IC family P-type ATPase [Acidimicrobiales bacterium]